MHCRPVDPGRRIRLFKPQGDRTMTTQFVSSGIVSSGVLVTSGNVLEVLSGGTADVTSVTSGGLQQVDAGGFVSGTAISAGGSDTVFGSDTGATVNSGGIEIVSSGGIASSATINNSGVLLLEGGSASHITINSGGSLVLSGGGSFSNVVNNGTIDFAGGGQAHMGGGTGSGVVEVTNGGTLTLTLNSGSSNFAGNFAIGDGSELVLTSAGAALGRPIDFAGANTELRIDDTVMPSDVISGFVPGGRWIFLDKTSFTASGSAQVLAGNVLHVVEGAVTDDLQLDPLQNYAGQTFVLLPHGLGDTLVGIGQVATVSSGGSISGTTISSGIIEEVFGTAISATVASGGTIVVFAGGTTSGTTLQNAGAEFLYGGTRVRPSAAAGRCGSNPAA
jgi:autotransporter passenger strand-loop-strand repeat protein